MDSDSSISQESQESCKPCQSKSVMGWYVALAVVIFIFLIYMRKICIEHFASKREKAADIQKKMYPYFYEGTATYQTYKTKIGGDAVEYNDVKKAYKDNKFNVEEISNVL